MNNTITVTCPRCNVKTTYAECGRCGHKFNESFLTSMDERKRRLKTMSGQFNIPAPTLNEIIHREAL